MVRKIIYACIAILIAVGSYFLSNYGKQHLSNSILEAVNLNYLLMVPFMYFMFLTFGIGQKYTSKMRLLFATFGAICYLFIGDLFEMNVIYGKASACLIGAAFMYLIVIAFGKKL